MKNAVTIRMGATKFTAEVNSAKGVVHFDLRKMDNKDRGTFIKTLVRSFREAGLQKQAAA